MAEVLGHKARLSMIGCSRKLCLRIRHFFDSKALKAAISPLQSLAGLISLMLA